MKRRASPRPEALATLSSAELANVLDQKRLADDAARTAKMMETAYQTLWAVLRRNHNLPEEFELDEATGQIFAKAGKEDG